MSPELILTLNYDLIITSLNDTPYFTLGHSCIDVNIVNKSIFDVFTFKNDDISYIAKGIKNNTITNISAYCNNNLFNISINRLDEHTSELQARITISYDVLCLKKKRNVAPSVSLLQANSTSNPQQPEIRAR